MRTTPEPDLLIDQLQSCGGVLELLLACWPGRRKFVLFLLPDGDEVGYKAGDSTGATVTHGDLLGLLEQCRSHVVALVEKARQR